MRREARQLPERSDHRGMSLMEVVMVVAVLAVMAGMAMPSFLGTIERYRLRAAAWELAGDLRLARQKAVSLQRGHRICFANCAGAVPPGGYVLERNDAGVWVRDVARTDLPDGVTFISNQDVVSFGIRGDGTGATVTFSNGVGDYVVVTSPTGRVRACKGLSCPS